MNGPWLAREDALGNRVLKSDQNLHNKLFFSCAVVGNSFHLEKVDGLAEVVDEHEAVIRLDAAPTTGRFASMVGTKTTVRVLSDAFLEDALKNPSKYAKLFTSTNGVSNSGNWETKGILWEPNSVSKLRQARRAFPELDVQFASPEILYPAKTIFNEVYNRLNAETKEHIEKALFGDTNGKDESSSNVDKGGRGYSFFSSSSSKSSSSEVTNTSELNQPRMPSLPSSSPYKCASTSTTASIHRTNFSTTTTTTKKTPISTVSPAGTAWASPPRPKSTNLYSCVCSTTAAWRRGATVSLARKNASVLPREVGKGSSRARPSIGRRRSRRRRRRRLVRRRRRCCWSKKRIEEV